MGLIGILLGAQSKSSTTEDTEFAERKTARSEPFPSLFLLSPLGSPCSPPAFSAHRWRAGLWFIVLWWVFDRASI